MTPEEVEKEIGIIRQFLEELPQKALNLGVRILLSVIFLLIGIWLIKLVRKIVKKSMNRASVDVGVVQFLDSFIKVCLYIILGFMIASGFGLDAASVVAVVGSAGVAVGLALQGSLSNFAGGVLILLLKPFKVGDYIKEDSKGNEGTVTEIQMFYTRLLTFDGKTVILPNGSLANTSLVNFTAANFRRLDLTVGISYDSDIKKAKDILNDLLNENPLVLPHKDKVVVVDELADSAVVLAVKCHVKTEDYWTLRGQLLEDIKLSFDKEGIAIPFPQLDVHMEHMEN
ncbi:MAG: mechanosensitive ion channel family protein [Lachnospiraceae bacterium]|nr:mechanosensitive ion channel family protein [Lachnospiraceae bacterium]